MKRPATLFLILSLVCCYSCTTPSIVATQSIQRGDEMNNASRYTESIKHYEAYLAQAPQLGLYRNPLKEAEVCRKLAHAYSTQGQYRQSYSYLKKALAIDSVQRDNKLNIMEDYRQLGLVNAYQGNYFVAKENLSRSLKMGEGMGTSIKDVKKSALADTQLSLAQVQLTTGDFPECEQNARAALGLYSSMSGEEIGALEAQLILGILERDRGNLELAIRLVRISQQMAEGQQMSTVRQTQALGEAFFLKGDWEEGLRYYLASLKQAEKGQIKPQIVLANLRVGDAYQRIGDTEKAGEYYRKASSLQMDMREDSSAMIPTLKMRLGNVQQAFSQFERSGSSIGSALASLRLAEMLMESKPDSAELMLGKAKDYFTQAKSKEGMCRTYFQLGRVSALKNRTREAMKYFNQARSGSSQSDMAWKCWFEMGRLYESTGKSDSARLAYRNSVAIVESVRGSLSVEEFKSLFSSSNVIVYDRLIMLLLRNKNGWGRVSADSAVAEAFDFSERARSRTFLDMLGNSKIEPKSTGDKSLLDEEQLLRLKIRQLNKELLKESSEFSYMERVRTELQEAETAYKDILEKIKLNNPAYSTMISVAPVSLRNIQSTLDEQTRLVEYWVSSDALAIWVVDRKGIKASITQVPESRLYREISLTRKLIAAQMDKESVSSLKRLYQYLLTPVASQFASAKNLIIIPHKSLHFLPFQALMDDKGRYLLEAKINTYVSPSASVLYYCANRKMSSGDKFLGLALGNEEIEGLPGLPGTALELNQISQLYPDLTRKTESEFTESYFKAHAAQYNYLHIATHGIFNKRQPLYSYMLMTPSTEDDGHLSVHEILGLSINSKLVTLSACETGLGELSNGDELVGLSRAFIYGGAPAVIVSLWKVDDATTSMLMARFYQYLTGGSNATEALSLAQQDLLTKNFAPRTSARGKSVDFDPGMLREMQKRDKQTTRMPYYWAAFEIIGNGAIR